MKTNKIFKQYVTGTAFNLQLTKRQCWGLLSLLDRKTDQWLASGQFVSIGKDLRCRGLIEPDIKSLKKRKTDHEIGKHPVNKLSRAGKLVVRLLKEAGMTMNNTKTISVIKGQDWWFSEK